MRVEVEDPLLRIVEAIRQGERGTIARAITLAESRTAEGRRILQRIYPYTGRAHVVGVTGPPGSGKSTLVDRLISQSRKEGKRVGVVAVDPSSPFTGGALLGDRLRMQRHATDPGVFIRSLATRGHLGGLSRATSDAVRILDAGGMDVVFVETVGVGQGEVEISKLADTVLLVTVPGLGDEVQTIKAGIMEIADLFVVNKADLAGADRTKAEIEAWLELAGGDGWRPSVMSVVATSGAGIEDLSHEIARHRRFLLEDNRARRKERERGLFEILSVVEERVEEILRKRIERGGGGVLDRLVHREIDPYTAAEELLREVLEDPSR